MTKHPAHGDHHSAVRNPSTIGSPPHRSIDSPPDRYDYIIGVLTAVLLLLAVVQQVPPLRDIAYGQIRAALYFGFGAVFSLSVLCSYRLRTPPVPAFLLIATWWSALLEIVLALLIPQLEHTPIAIPALMCFALYFVGSSLQPSKRYMQKLLIVVMVCTIGAGAIIVLSDVGSFTILDNYATQSKNQVGPMVACGAVIAFWFAIRMDSRSFWFRICMLACFTVGLWTLVVIRNRAGTLALLLVALSILFRAWRRMRTGQRLLAISCSLVLMVGGTLLGALQPVLSGFGTSFTAGYYGGDLNTLSAGRSSVYTEAISSLAQSPAIGMIANPATLTGTPHNYLLNTAASFGLILGAPLLWAYFRYWYCSLSKTVQDRESPNDWSADLAKSLLLVSLIISLFEYAAPYGPGTSYAVVWILVGYSGVLLRGQETSESLLPPTRQERT